MQCSNLKHFTQSFARSGTCSIVLNRLKIKFGQYSVFNSISNSSDPGFKFVRLIFQTGWFNQLSFLLKVVRRRLLVYPCSRPRSCRVWWPMAYTHTPTGHRGYRLNWTYLEQRAAMCHRTQILVPGLTTMRNEISEAGLARHQWLTLSHPKYPDVPIAKLCSTPKTTSSWSTTTAN